uniref:Uncharacterized protein n=1 Tax=Rhizophora mucronata TaxID=61149 RepID=A0A2P2Q0B5_RHIMU
MRSHSKFSLTTLSYVLHFTPIHDTEETISINILAKFLAFITDYGITLEKFSC